MPSSGKLNFTLDLPDKLSNSGGYMPWRQNTSPYFILVSEIMLQQTQVSRVIPKFESFMKKFPTIVDLATAKLEDVLACWSGLGYNRRALWLHQAAQQIVSRHRGVIPDDIRVLTTLKGIGKNTAAAICVYAFNQPHVYIETNIRTVFIYHYFNNSESVSDADLMPLISANLVNKNPREWYWSLMDYGVQLKKQHRNPSRKSKHHSKQSAFEGSKRQLRGQILKSILAGVKNVEELQQTFAGDKRFADVLQDLQRDGLLIRDGGRVAIV